MRKIFGVCTLAITVFAVSAVALPRAEAMTFGSLAGLRAASHEANLVQSVDYYGYHQPYGYYQPYAYYPWYGYYRTVCRAWWKGCGLEPGHYSNVWPSRYYHYRPHSYGYR